MAYLKKVTDATKDNGVGNGWYGSGYPCFGEELDEAAFAD